MVVKPVIPALGRLRKEDSKFEASLGYILSPYHKKKKFDLMSSHALKVYKWIKRIGKKISFFP
jgi:hypothetical protein